jgi:hypothetical protein
VLLHYLLGFFFHRFHICTPQPHDRSSPFFQKKNCNSLHASLVFFFDIVVSSCTYVFAKIFAQAMSQRRSTFLFPTALREIGARKARLTVAREHVTAFLHPTSKQPNAFATFRTPSLGDNSVFKHSNSAQPRTSAQYFYAFNCFGIYLPRRALVRPMVLGRAPSNFAVVQVRTFVGANRYSSDFKLARSRYRIGFQQIGAPPSKFPCSAEAMIRLSPSRFLRSFFATDDTV